MLEHVTRDDEGEYQREGGGRQLPRPEVALEEQRHEREGGCDEGADDVGAESGHHSRHETAHAAKQGQEREEAGLEEPGDARDETAESTRHANEEPHEKGVAIGLANRFLVLIDVHAVTS